MVSPEAEVPGQPSTDGQRASWSNNAAWFLAAATIEPAGDLAKGEELASFAVKVNSESANFRHTLAQILYEQQKYAEARTQIERAIELDLKDEPTTNRGVAGSAVQSLVGLKPQHEHRKPQYYALLATTLWKLGEKEAARGIMARLPDLSEVVSKSAPQDRRYLKRARELITPPE
jgi:tetratricopeptide (TPR) repeat protein